MPPLLLLPLLLQLTTPPTHAKKIVAKPGADVELWTSAESARPCLAARAMEAASKLPARRTEPTPQVRLDGEDLLPQGPPPACSSGFVGQLAGGTLVLVVEGLPGASRKEKALKCDGLKPVRVVGGPHEGKIGCVVDSALGER